MAFADNLIIEASKCRQRCLTANTRHAFASSVWVYRDSIGAEINQRANP
jgi:hypothetical protein